MIELYVIHNNCMVLEILNIIYIDESIGALIHFWNTILIFKKLEVLMQKT